MELVERRWGRELGVRWMEINRWSFVPSNAWWRIGINESLRESKEMEFDCWRI